MIKWLGNIGDALSQLANVILFNGNANESISGGAWRTQSCFVPFIDALFFWKDDHCKHAYFNDIEYAKQLLGQISEN